MKINLPDYKISPGKGWLRLLLPHQVPYKHSPPFRGWLQLPEGRKVSLVGWYVSNHYGTMMYIHVSTPKTRRRAFFKSLDAKKAEDEEYRKTLLQKAKFEAGPKKRKYVKRPPQPPKEVKRKDVIR